MKGTINMYWFKLLSVLLFSISSNIDNVVVGIAYGIKKIEIGFIANLIIAAVTTIGTLLSMSLGWYISKFLPHSISNILGAGVIVILGIYIIIQSLIKLAPGKDQNKLLEYGVENLEKDRSSLALKNLNEMFEYAENTDVDKSGHIDMKEAFIVASGLTFNNLGTGVAASITGVSVILTVTATFIFSILTILIGESIGKNVFGRFLGNYAPIIAGILLIMLGIIEMFN